MNSPGIVVIGLIGGALVATEEIEDPRVAGIRHVPRGRPIEVGLDAGEVGGVGETPAGLRIARGVVIRQIPQRGVEQMRYLTRRAAGIQRAGALML